MKIFSAVLFTSSRAIAVLSVAAVLGFASLPASAATAGNADTVVAVDWKSLDRNQKIAEVWVTYTFARTITLGHGLHPHRSQRIQYAIACEDRSIALSQWLLTDETAGSGQVVWSGREDSLNFSTPWAGSTEQDLVAQACEYKRGNDTAAMFY